MKKVLLALTVLFVAKTATAQDTIYFEDFNNEFTATYNVDYPPGADYDSVGYSVDLDGLADGSGSSPARSDAWFLAYAFATLDSLTQDGDTNFVMASNSWFDPAGVAQNYLITPSIYLADNTGMLYWKSAPRQTPKYLDGYKVLVSTTTNFEDQFTDTLFVAAEYLSEANPLPDSTFAGYTFSQGDDVHGLDGTYIYYDGDSARFFGVLKPHSVSLAQYAGQKIFLAFLHDSDDDNLISIDDIYLTGNGTVNVDENPATVSVSLYPNPAVNTANITFNVTKSGMVSLDVVDMNGKLVETRSLGARLKGQHMYELNTAAYSNGNYLLNIRTAGGNKALNMIISK